MTRVPQFQVADLLCLSRLFAYPEDHPASEDWMRIKEFWDYQEDRPELPALQAEYVRLFINSLPEVPCPPYGSFYLEGTLMGESTVTLKKLYARRGWHTDEMADHFAVELEFLALLAAECGGGAFPEGYQEVWEHLCRWAPEFLARVEKYDRSGLYRAAARYAQKVLGLQADFAPSTTV